MPQAARLVRTRRSVMNQHPIYLCTSTPGEYDSERALVDDIRQGHIELPTTIYLLDPLSDKEHYGIYYDVTQRIAQAFHDSVKWDATYSIHEHPHVLDWLQSLEVVGLSTFTELPPESPLMATARRARERVS